MNGPSKNESNGTIVKSKSCGLIAVTSDEVTYKLLNTKWRGLEFVNRLKTNLDGTEVPIVTDWEPVEVEINPITEGPQSVYNFLSAYDRALVDRFMSMTFIQQKEVMSRFISFAYSDDPAEDIEKLCNNEIAR